MVPSNRARRDSSPANETGMVSEQSLVSLNGTVKQLVYRNRENGFSVVRLEVANEPSPVSVVGVMPELEEGAPVSCNGNWKEHPKFGRQFAAETVLLESPSTLEGLRVYLGSKAVEGIGKVHADRLVKKFGDKLFSILEEQPQRLREVPGIGPERARKIAESWSRNRVNRDLMVHLHGLGITPAVAASILGVYGPDAVQVVSSDPFQLIKDVRGIGFKTADKLAGGIGIANDHPGRIAAGLRHLVYEARNRGNCGIRVAELVEQAVGLLDVPQETVRSSAGLLADSRELVLDRIDGELCAFPRDLYDAEGEICSRMRVIASGVVPWGAIDAGPAIRRAEAESNMKYGESQAEAIRSAVSAKFTVITGGPGVGKTTIVNAILRILGSRKIEIRICAPTGRAAKRVTELTGREAMTIHRLLEIDPETGGFRHDANNPLDCDLLVVDESSMIDVPLMDCLLQAVPDEAAVIMVGDVDQLPSVGPGRVLDDVMASRDVRVVKLTEIYRQDAGSRVVDNAHLINSGRPPDLSKPEALSDFYFIPAQEPAQAVDKVLKYVSEHIPGRFGIDPVRDIQVLSPMIRGEAGVQSLNAKLREALNPSPGAEIKANNSAYAVGDKVMQIRNDYSKGIFNGDIGFVVSVHQDEDTLKVDFDGRTIEIGPDDLEGIMPAYAVTIHKSQGSEFPAVVVPILTQHYVMLKRNLLYTAVTRARSLLVLIGQQRAVEIAVRTDDQRQRMTRLGNLLRQAGSF